MSSFMLSAAPILWLILVILLIVLEVASLSAGGDMVCIRSCRSTDCFSV